MGSRVVWGEVEAVVGGEVLLKVQTDAGFMRVSVV
jgi:hypothetical protein